MHAHQKVPAEIVFAFPKARLNSRQVVASFWATQIPGRREKVEAAKRVKSMNENMLSLTEQEAHKIDDQQL